MDIVSLIYSALKVAAMTILAVIMALGARFGVIVLPQTATTTTSSASTTAVAVPFPTATATPAATTKPKSAATASSPAPAVATPATQNAAQNLPAQAGIDPEALNVQTRTALVNVLCTTLAGGALQPISGSGVIIDTRGVVLTNAHVGQFFLLRDYGTPGNVDCIIRTGSPAKAAYRAMLLYLPPIWVADNAKEIKAQQATGTGENDYALLLITGTINPGDTLPMLFSHLSMHTASPDIGNEMLLAAYPAGFLSGQFISSQLYASSAFAYVTQLFSFTGTQQVDLFSIGGSIESQAGSSGGAAVRLDGTLAGIITTATLATSTETRDLRAITIGHINRSLALQGQGGIAELLSGDVATKAADFNAKVAPAETAVFEAVLDKK